MSEKKRRGFAVMDPKKVSAIASKGGKAAQAGGRAHQFTSEEAREAGRKGGYAAHAARRRGEAKRPSGPPGVRAKTDAELDDLERSNLGDAGELE